MAFQRLPLLFQRIVFTQSFVLNDAKEVKHGNSFWRDKIYFCKCGSVNTWKNEIYRKLPAAAF